MNKNNPPHNNEVINALWSAVNEVIKLTYEAVDKVFAEIASGRLETSQLPHAIKASLKGMEDQLLKVREQLTTAYRTLRTTEEISKEEFMLHIYADTARAIEDRVISEAINYALELNNKQQLTRNEAGKIMGYFLTFLTIALQVAREIIYEATTQPENKAPTAVNEVIEETIQTSGQILNQVIEYLINVNEGNVRYATQLIEGALSNAISNRLPLTQNRIREVIQTTAPQLDKQQLIDALQQEIIEAIATLILTYALTEIKSREAGTAIEQRNLVVLLALTQDPEYIAQLITPLIILDAIQKKDPRKANEILTELKEQIEKHATPETITVTEQDLLKINDYITTGIDQDLRNMQEKINEILHEITSKKRTSLKKQTYLKLQKAAKALSEANALYGLRHFEEALRRFYEAESIFRELGERYRLAGVLMEEGNVLYSLRRFKEALDRYDKAESIFRELGERYDLAKVLVNEGVTLASMHFPKEALRRFYEAESIFRELGERYDLAKVLGNEGNALYGLRHFEEALRRFYEAESIFRELGERYDLARALVSEGNALYRLRRFKEALDRYDKAESIFRELGSKYDLAGILMNEGATLADMHCPEEALTKYRESLEVVESVVGSLGSPLAKEREVSEFFWGYVRAAEIAYGVRGFVDGLSFCERLKGRNLVDVIVESPSGGLRELMDERDWLRRRISALEGEVRRSWGRVSEGKLSELRRLRSELSDLEAYIMATAYKGVGIDPRRVRDELGELPELLKEFFGGKSWVLIDYVVYGGGVVAWVWGSDGYADMLKYEWGKGRFTLHGFLKEVVGRGGSYRWNKLWRRRGERNPLLEVLFPGDLLERVLKYDVMVVSPFGPIRLLNFGVLSVGSKYLLEEVAVVYVPSLLVLKRKVEEALARGVRYRTPRFRRGFRALILGNPKGDLPGAEEEARYIKELVEREANGSVIYAVGEGCSREFFWRHMPDADLVVLATHSVFDYADPLQSRVVLSDGDITVSDLFMWGGNLRAGLVVLSSCESGGRDPWKLSVEIGLPSELLRKGALSVVATFRSVDDKFTYRLMTKFYRGVVVDGKPPAEALRDAQLSLLTEYEDRLSPQTWAPFMLYGLP